MTLSVPAPARGDTRPPTLLRRAPARLWARLTTCVLVVAVLVRLARWVVARSLTHDEAVLTERVLGASSPQVAPLWRWVERSAVELLGDGERALRVLPLVAGIAVLVLTAAVARRVLPAPLVPAAVLLVAIDPAVLAAADEVDPASVDAAVVLLLVRLAAWVLDREPPDVRAPHRRAAAPPVVLSAVGVAAVWASPVAVLPLVAAGTGLLLRGGGRLGTALLLVPWAVSLAAVSVLRPGPDVLAAVSALRADPPPEDALVLAATLLTGALVVAGTALLLQRRRDLAVLLAVPLGLGVLAAAAVGQQLPGRPAAWAVPLLAVLVAAAVPVDRPDLRPAGVPLVALAVLVATLPSLRELGPALVQRQGREQLGPVVAELSARLRPGDLVLPFAETGPALAYYGPRSGIAADGVVRLVPGGRCEDDAALQAVFERRRVWVVASHVEDSRSGGTRGDLLSRVDRVSAVGDRVVRNGAQAVLFDPAAAGTAPVVRRNPRLCPVVTLLPGR